MELIAKGEFYRNVAKHRNRELAIAIDETLRQVQQAKSIEDIQQLKKLRKFSVYYRIKVKDDYRIGVIIRGNKVWLACFGHRNNIYKNFP